MMVDVSYGSGVVNFSSPIILDSEWDRIIGNGTILNYTGTGPAIRNVLPVGKTIQRGITLAGFVLQGGGIELESTYKARVQDLWILGATDTGLKIKRSNQGAFAAYNHIENVVVDMVGKAGNGIHIASGSELNYILNSNASYAQIGVYPTNTWDEPVDVRSGIGILLESSGNIVEGGEIDRCMYPVVIVFGKRNRIKNFVNNALIHAIVLKGASENQLQVTVGRCDTKLPNGATNPFYGKDGWSAITVCNRSYGNRSELIFALDEEAPLDSLTYGGWDYACWEAAMTGRNAMGVKMPNRYIATPENGKTSLKWNLAGGEGVLIR